MAVAAERRDIMEAVGVAVSSSDLSASEQREKHIDLIAAVGAASARLHYGDQATTIAGAALRPTGTRADHIAAELASSLWRLKAGKQEQTALRVAGLFVQWMREKPALAQIPGEQLGELAKRIVQEWAWCTCARCRGSGLLEVDRRMGKVTPRSYARNARYVTCDQCQGSRRASPNHQRRAECLGISREVYDQDKWYRRFTVGLIWLDQIARRLKRPLQIESGRRSIAAQ